MLTLINSASLIADQSMAALLHRKPASSVAAGDGRSAQANNKRYIL
jgi:hypothetical protein